MITSQARQPAAVVNPLTATNLMLTDRILALEDNYGVSSVINPPATWADLYQRLITDRKGKPTKSVNFTETFEGNRYRCILANSMHGYGITMRKLLTQIPRITEDLKLPWNVIRPLMLEPGLILIAGQMGSGKSTTLQAAVDALEPAVRGALGIVEDPVEIIHPDLTVIQRQVGEQTESFAEAIRDFMRQYRQTIIVGEIRDPETAEAAVIAASSGHRVVGTIHSESAPDAIVRMKTLLDPKFERILPSVLSGIWWQHLVRFGDQKRAPVVVYESLECDQTVKDMIQSDKLVMLPAQMKRQGRMNMAEVAIDHIQHRRASKAELRQWLSNKGRVEALV